MDSADNPAFGAFAPGWLDRLVIAVTSRMPNNWLGLRLAILFRRAVTMRMPYPAGALDVERWGLKVRLHPRDNGCEKNLLFTPQIYEPTELKELGADIDRARQRQTPSCLSISVQMSVCFPCSSRRVRGVMRVYSPPDFNVIVNPNVPIATFPMALSDDAKGLAVQLDRRDRGGTRTTKAETGAPADAVRVPSQSMLRLLEKERVEAVDALKIDVEGFEDVILGPFFQAAPPQLLPRLIIIEDCRGSWKTDLMSIMAAKGYSAVTRSKLNFILQRLPR